MSDKLTSIVCRVFFVVAFIMIFIALLDRFIRLFGWSISGMPYEPGRIFEFSAMLITFVIALLLRQIRQLLNKQG